MKQMIGLKTLEAQSAAEKQNKFSACSSSSTSPVTTLSCPQILYMLTSQEFNFSQNSQFYWILTATIEEAKLIVKNLQESKYSLNISSGKITQSEKFPGKKYRVTVESFNPNIFKNTQSDFKFQKNHT